MKTFAVVLLLASTSSLSHAYWDNRAEGKVKQIIVEQSKVIIELEAGPVSRGENCNPYMNLWKSNPSFEEIYTMALTAKASGKKFKVHFAPCTSGERPNIGAARIFD